MPDFLFTKPHTPPTCTGRCSPFCSPASFKSSASTCLPRFWPSLLSTFGLLEKAHCSFLLLPSHFFFVPRCASKPVPPSRYSVRLSRDVEKAAASSRARPGARADYINLARARRHPFDLAANVCRHGHNSGVDQSLSRTRLQRTVVFVLHVPDLSHRPLVDLAIAPRDHATRALDLVRPRRAHSHFHLYNLYERRRL